MWRALIAERYSLVEPVGSGGMGRVWLARDEMLRREVAIKEVVPPDWMSESERDLVRERTMREARAAARLNHPNVVKIYDVVHAEGRPWIVMEYVQSRSLYEVVEQDGPLAPRRAAQIGLCVLYALTAAHQAGVLHRDVKPHNVLITEDGRVVLTDFGLATFDDGDGAMTRAGLVMGSPQYVAPERARDGVSTVETDLWSLGATLFAAVEGHSPYARDTAMATLTALATAPPDPAPRAGVLRPVLGGLLRKDPRHRLNAEEAERLLRKVARPSGRERRDSPDARTRFMLPRPRRSVEGLRPERSRQRSRGQQFPDRRPRRRSVYVAAGVTALLLATVGTALALDSQRGGRAEQLGGVGAWTTASPTPAAAAAPAALPCGTPPTGVDVPTRPPPLASPRYALADGGFGWHDDPSGFQIAVPQSWTYFVDGSVVCFREPDGGKLLAIDTAPELSGDPIAHWTAEEKRVTSAGALAGYTRVNILPNRFFEGGADWDCTWNNPRGERMRARRELFRTSPTQAYTILWVTRALDWPGNLAYLRLINASFEPAT